MTIEEFAETIAAYLNGEPVDDLPDVLHVEVPVEFEHRSATLARAISEATGERTSLTTRIAHVVEIEIARCKQ